MNAYLAALRKLAARSQALRLTTYQMIGGLGVAYALFFLLFPMLVTGSSGIFGESWRALQNMDWVLISIGAPALVFACFLLVAGATGALAALVGLVMFSLDWSPETLRLGWRTALLLPFCYYFLFRANASNVWVPIVVAALSMFTMLGGLSDARVVFPNINRTTLLVLMWVWLSFVGTCVINLLVARCSDYFPPRRNAMVTTTGGQWVAPVSPAVAPGNAAPSYKHPAARATITLANVIGMDPVKARLLEAGREALKGDQSSSNGILLYGPPGNGKTYMAEALAGSLGIPMIQYNFGTSASKFVNETTENSMQVFTDAVAQAPCMLFIDEVEAILSERSNQGFGATEYPKTVSALLTQLVFVRKRGVVVVAATNFLDLVDSAASREGRFDTKIEISAPDAPARRGLILSKFAEAVNGTIELPTDIVESLTIHWDGFSVSRITAVAHLVGRRLMAPNAPASVPTITLFQTALRETQGSHGDIVLSKVTGLEALFYDGDVRPRLLDLAESMRNTFEFERLGGQVIGGVLFSGPPGTGKTIAASALAKSAGWAMIITNGTDLAREPEKIKKVMIRAIDMKPCILFIDEADALISDRSKNWNSMATNLFLAQTGDDRASLRDVMLIAATNNPEGTDAAMLREGRFGEHIQFTLPDSVTIAMFLNDESEKSSLNLDEFLVTMVSLSLVGKPLSDVRGALKRAANRAANRAMRQGNGAKAVITIEDFSK